MNIYGLPTDQIDPLWPLLEPYVAAALLKGSPVPETTPEGVKERLISQEAQGWIAVDEHDDIKAFMNTYVATTETVKRLVIENVAGIDMKTWLHLYEAVEEYAVQVGADQVLIRGRPGWAKVLKDQGFETQYVALAKTL